MPTIHVPEILRGVTLKKTHLHITGGLRGAKNGTDWVVGPILKDGALVPIGSFTDEKIGDFCRAIGVTVLGSDEVNTEDAPLQSRVWSPILGQPILPSNADDIWQGIAVTAHEARDVAYASSARHLSISLRAAGIRLRDASDEYHKQLISALLRGQKPNLRFTNIPLFDLHLAFHSLLSEMASARDYLASLTALQIGAPPKVDAMNRLAEWVERKMSPEAVSKIPELQILLNAYDKTGQDSWLYQLTEYRNLFLHRKPIQASELARWLVLKEAQVSFGNILTTQMRISSVDGGEVLEALELFSGLHNRLCRLAFTFATRAKYKPDHVHIVVGD